MASLHVLRVFTAPDGTLGNPLGVFLDGGEIPGDRRQDVARDLGFAETVFVDDPGRGEVQIFAPEMEMPFAGHPSVGTAWLLREERAPVTALRMPAGEVPVRYEAELTWISANPEWGPPFEYVEAESPADVDALNPSPDLRYCWAWEDEDAGRVRARSFVPDAGIAEDEATGSAARSRSARARARRSTPGPLTASSRRSAAASYWTRSTTTRRPTRASRAGTRARSRAR